MRSDYSPYGIVTDVIRLHNGPIPSDVPYECDKCVLNESNSSQISDVIVPDVGYYHNQSMSSRIVSQ